MSHVVANPDFVITDLDALAEACPSIGLEFRRDQLTWKWYGTWVNDYSAADAAYKSGIKPEDYGKCLHAIGVQGNATAYEIGLVPNPHGEGFIPVYDFYGSSGDAIRQRASQGLEKLRVAYSTVLAEKMLGQYVPGQKAWQVEKQKQPDGSIKLVATR